jgi:hypothetical protein
MDRVDHLNAMTTLMGGVDQSFCTVESSIARDNADFHLEPWPW